jgi:hypothetical protein
MYVARARGACVRQILAKAINPSSRGGSSSSLDKFGLLSLYCLGYDGPDSA